MVPKSGDLQQTKNWKPIAIVKITCNIFAKMLHQSMDQAGSRRTGIDHALAVFKTVCGKALNGIPKFGLQAWT